MPNFPRGPRWLLAAACLLAPLLAIGGEHPEPRVGQPGKDVIWVPTPDQAVRRMLTLAGVGPTDFLIDLGSGDGRIVITAAKQFGARGFGVDLNPDLVRLSVQRAAEAGVSNRARFYVRDLFMTDLTRATVITLYLLPELNFRLRPTLRKLAPGTRIVSHAFDMGDWHPDVLDTSTNSTIRLWIVPADVRGTWTWTHAGASGARQLELDMSQQFQRIGGTVRIGQLRLRLQEPSLNGSEIRFTLIEQQRRDAGVRYEYRGRVNGNTIEGEIVSSTGEETTRWLASRRFRPPSAD